MIYLVIYCLNCIRPDLNATYKTGLIFDYETMMKGFIIFTFPVEVAGKTLQLSAELSQKVSVIRSKDESNNIIPLSFL